MDFSGDEHAVSASSAQQKSGGGVGSRPAQTWPNISTQPGLPADYDQHQHSIEQTPLTLTGAEFKATIGEDQRNPTLCRYEFTRPNTQDTVAVFYPTEYVIDEAKANPTSVALPTDAFADVIIFPNTNKKSMIKLEILAVAKAYSTAFSDIDQNLDNITTDLKTPETRDLMRAMLTQALLSFCTISENHDHMVAIINKILFICYAAGYDILKDSSLCVDKVIADGRFSRDKVEYKSFLDLAYRCNFNYAINTFYQFGHAPLSEQQLDAHVFPAVASNQPTAELMMLALYYQPNLSSAFQEKIRQEIFKQDSTLIPDDATKYQVMRSLLLFGSHYKHGYLNGGTKRIEKLHADFWGASASVSAAPVVTEHDDYDSGPDEHEAGTGGNQTSEAKDDGSYHPGSKLLTSLATSSADLAAGNEDITTLSVKEFMNFSTQYANKNKKAMETADKYTRFRHEELVAPRAVFNHLVANPPKASTAVSRSARSGFRNPRDFEQSTHEERARFVTYPRHQYQEAGDGDHGFSHAVHGAVHGTVHGDEHDHAHGVHGDYDDHSGPPSPVAAYDPHGSRQTQRQQRRARVLADDEEYLDESSERQDEDPQLRRGSATGRKAVSQHFAVADDDFEHDRTRAVRRNPHADDAKEPTGAGVLADVDPDSVYATVHPGSQTASMYAQQQYYAVSSAVGVSGYDQPAFLGDGNSEFTHGYPAYGAAAAVSYTGYSSIHGATGTGPASQYYPQQFHDVPVGYDQPRLLAASSLKPSMNKVQAALTVAQVLHTLQQVKPADIASQTVEHTNVDIIHNHDINGNQVNTDEYHPAQTIHDVLNQQRDPKAQQKEMARQSGSPSQTKSLSKLLAEMPFPPRPNPLVRLCRPIVRSMQQRATSTTDAQLPTDATRAWSPPTYGNGADQV